jgi:hypothetical protein
LVLKGSLIFWGLVHRNIPREMDDKEEKWPKLHLQAILTEILPRVKQQDQRGGY